jgi:hypothetical protein
MEEVGAAPLIRSLLIMVFLWEVQVEVVMVVITMVVLIFKGLAELLIQVEVEEEQLTLAQVATVAQV